MADEIRTTISSPRGMTSEGGPEPRGAASDNQTTLPPLDYDRGEKWIHGWDKDGNPAVAPHLIQRDGETLGELIERIVRVEQELADATA